MRGNNNNNSQNKRRGVQSVTANKGQRTIRFEDEQEYEDDVPTAAVPPAAQQIVPVSVGQAMSQRVPRSFL